MENENLVESFMTTMNERNAMSIAADDKYTGYQARDVLEKKYGIKRLQWHNEVIDGEECILYTVNNSYYAKDSEGKFWNVDSHKVGTNSIKYQLNSTVTDPDTLDFLNAIEYAYSKEKSQRTYDAKASDKEMKAKNLADAKRIINVTVLDGTFRNASDYADDVDDERWSTTDEESEFDVTITVGQTEVFKGKALPLIRFSGSNELSYYKPATMYDHWGDPGDPEEGAGHISIELEGVTDDDIVYLDANDNDYYASDLAEKVPEGKFRDMFIKYADYIVGGAIDSYIEQHGETSYEEDW